jgi:hypothetical protein
MARKSTTNENVPMAVPCIELRRVEEGWFEKEKR